MSLFHINLLKKSEERYDLSKFMEFIEGESYDPLTSAFFLEVQNIRLGGIYTIRGEDSRPDLLSYKLYEDTQYWWVIMLYNSFSDISEIRNGEEIRFPAIDDLENFYFSLNLDQKLSGK